MLVSSTERLLLTLWVGSLWAIGYIAVPVAFASLADTAIAGNYAGKLFSAVNLLGLGCGSVLLLTMLVRFGRQSLTAWRLWVILVMVALTLVFSFYLQPEIVAIKQMDWQQDSDLAERFSLLHTISKNLYMVVSLLGLTLVITTDKLLNQLRA
ncbi:MAG: DUF4149 domain-containing protein [Gammaproteobacteria bacterium]|nr:DUF4149 domain-containing protein [Gammaproteobacteria bacterium]MDH5592245.1 DUF4149 domain-containing protein [Gammaproteobacteria bacterium]